ncbi:hypothetical protein TrCOL_g12232 [Triparma columacea]|uniref:Cytochrome b561 domain-containing protein n=1 Tax=Triparma columacea TaxID=722753 RepID=A0A9W7G1P4_9STRA|nr:hypothetical protein TrCOL_g12232 [Triparma columacea]
MSNSDAVILTSNSLKKYDIQGYSKSSIKLYPDSQQTLINPTFTQETSGTCMSFSRTAGASESDEISIDPSGDQHFIYAYGSEGQENLSHHSISDRGSLIINLSDNSCEVDVGGDAKLKAAKAHGILMILSWLVFAPSTVTLSRFGKLKFPDSKWFNMHKILALLIFSCSVAGYLIMHNADYPHDPKNKNHFRIGLAVLILGAVVQPLLGILRPPKEAPRYDNIDVEVEKGVEMVASEGGHMMDEEGKGNIKDHSYLTKRSLWKYSHQAVAFVCILLGFLNVLTGLNMKVLDESLAGTLRILSIASVAIFVAAFGVMSHNKGGYISRVQNVLVLEHVDK